MEIRGEKAALDEAVAEARQRELQELPRQLGLFDEEQTETAEHEQNGTAVATRGPGRPLGSRNKRTDEAATISVCTAIRSGAACRLPLYRSSPLVYSMNWPRF